MACAKPMLVCSGANTPIINFLKDKDCAYLVEETTLESKTDKVVEILRSISKNNLLEMGKRGHADINKNYSKAAVTEMYVKLVDGILK